MKQRITIIALVILVFVCATRASDLGVSESIIDYGTVKEGPPVVKTVVLTNIGALSITIARAAAS